MNINDLEVNLTVNELLDYRNRLKRQPSHDQIDDIVDNCFPTDTLSAKFGIKDSQKHDYHYTDSQTGELTSPRQAQSVVNARLNVEVERLKSYRRQLKATPTVDKSAEILEALANQGYDEAMNCYPSYTAHDIWTWREMYDELLDLSIDDEDCKDYKAENRDEKQARYVKDSKYMYFSCSNDGKPVDAKETADFISTQIKRAVHPEEVI